MSIHNRKFFVSLGAIQPWKQNYGQAAQRRGCGHAKPHRAVCRQIPIRPLTSGGPPGGCPSACMNFRRSQAALLKPGQAAKKSCGSAAGKLGMLFPVFVFWDYVWPRGITKLKSLPGPPPAAANLNPPVAILLRPGWDRAGQKPHKGDRLLPLACGRDGAALAGAAIPAQKSSAIITRSGALPRTPGFRPRCGSAAKLSVYIISASSSDTAQ